MNILHLGKYYPPYMGGIENVTSDLVGSQVEATHSVSAIVHQHVTKKSFSKEVKGSKAIYRAPIWGVLAFVPIAPSFGFYLRKILSESQFEILHMHMPNASCFWTLFSKRARKVPWVIHWHSDVLGAAPDWRVKLLYPFYRIFERALLKKAAAVIVTSPIYLETSVPLSAFKDKCCVVPLGINDQSIEGAKPPLAKDGELKLLVIGRLTYYKGHKYLIEAVARLVVQGKKVHLTIVGTGELEQQLKYQVEILALENSVTFAGSVDNNELSNQLHSCDLLCLLSIERTEAFGVVLLEAMRASKPCLVTDVPGSGMSWVVQDGVTGLVAKAGNVDSIAEKLSLAAEYPAKLVEMGKAGRKRFEQHFTIEKVAAQVDEVYKGVLGL